MSRTCPQNNEISMRKGNTVIVISFNQKPLFRPIDSSSELPGRVDWYTSYGATAAGVRSLQQYCEYLRGIGWSR